MRKKVKLIKNNVLYVVATPIGNLDDISVRAVKTLAEVDVILAEDTRVTQKLLSHLGLKKTVVSLHQHTTGPKMREMAERMAAGEVMALVTDAGTPAISDPGGMIVELAAERGVQVVPIPGPSAMTAALSVSGFPVDAFTFLGFPPAKKRRKTFFEEVAAIEHAVVLFESKHRIHRTLEELSQDRKALVARELTKMFETLYRGSIEEIRGQLKESEKGEFVIVLAPTNW